MKLPNSRTLGINLLLCLTSVSIFFGSGELLARLQYTPQKKDSGSVFEYDRHKGFQLKKNLESTFEGKPFMTNSFGHRSPEISVEKPKSVKRILMLGDSIAFGHGVLDTETYAHFLEGSLNKNPPEGERFTFQTINTAAPMNFPSQEYYDLERGLKFDPDVIVLQLTLNDIYDAPIFNDITTPRHIDLVLKERSALYLFLKDMHRRVQFQDPTGENIANKAKEMEIISLDLLMTDPNHPDVIFAWDETLGWLQKITDLAKDKDIPLVLMITPYVLQFNTNEEISSPQRKLQEFAKENDIIFVDLLEILKLLFADMVHPELTRGEITEEIILESFRNNPEKIESFWNMLFMDYDHPTVDGNGLISSVLHTHIINALQNR